MTHISPSLANNSRSRERNHSSLFSTHSLPADDQLPLYTPPPPTHVVGKIRQPHILKGLLEFSAVLRKHILRACECMLCVHMCVHACAARALLLRVLVRVHVCMCACVCMRVRAHVRAFWCARERLCSLMTCGPWHRDDDSICVRNVAPELCDTRMHYRVGETRTHYACTGFLKGCAASS